MAHQTPKFSHTFTVNFAVFAPKQDGARNWESVYSFVLQITVSSILSMAQRHSLSPYGPPLNESLSALTGSFVCCVYGYPFLGDVNSCKSPLFMSYTKLF